MDDHYKELGITPDFPAEAISVLRKALNRRYHPDVGSKSDEERSKRINAACDVLGNPTERAAYDKLLAKERKSAEIRRAEAEAKKRAQQAREAREKRAPSAADASGVGDAFRNRSSRPRAGASAPFDSTPHPPPPSAVAPNASATLASDIHSRSVRDRRNVAFALLALVAVAWLLISPAGAIGLVLWALPLVALGLAVVAVGVAFTEGIGVGFTSIVMALIGLFVFWVVFSISVSMWIGAAHTDQHCPVEVGVLPSGHRLCNANRNNWYRWRPPFFQFASMD